MTSLVNQADYDLDRQMAVILAERLTSCRCDAADPEARLLTWDSLQAEDIRRLLHRNFL